MSETYNNCVIPTDRHIDVEEHVWVKEENGTVTIGMTDVAQSLAKKFLHAHVKSEGKNIDKGKSVATVESSKFVGPVKSPVAGEIVEVNDAVASSADAINMDPYGDGWIVKMEPSNLEEDLEGTHTGQEAVEAYREKIDEEEIECEHLEGSVLE